MAHLAKDRDQLRAACEHRFDQVGAILSWAFIAACAAMMRLFLAALAVIFGCWSYSGTATGWPLRSRWSGPRLQRALLP